MTLVWISIALIAIYAIGWAVSFSWLASMKGPVTVGAARHKREAIEAMLWPVGALGMILLLSADWSWKRSKTCKAIKPLDTADALSMSNGYQGPE